MGLESFARSSDRPSFIREIREIRVNVLFRLLGKGEGEKRMAKSEK
jgi:hypothetical protein